jgi:hypothetical protein
MKLLTFVFQKILSVAAGEECPPFLQLFLLCVPLCLLALYQFLSVQLQTKHIRYMRKTTSHKYFSLIDTGNIKVVAGSCSALCNVLLGIYLDVRRMREVRSSYGSDCKTVSSSTMWCQYHLQQCDVKEFDIWVPTFQKN